MIASFEEISHLTRIDRFQPRANFDIRLGPFVLWIFITFNKKSLIKSLLSIKCSHWHI